MESQKAISPPGTPDTCSSYQELLRQGIAHCQALGGDRWTDYNQHDPGVTILQQLCFALTDLAYRTDFDIADILAEDKSKLQKQALYTGDDVLTCDPVTTNDYRKLLYDRIDGVKNAWLVKVTNHPVGVQGLYEVLIEMREDVVEESAKARILREVRQYMRNTRNLGEDLDNVVVLQPQPIRVEATIEIKPQADPSHVLAEVLFGIQNSLVPFPSVQIIDELFRLQTPDRIWNGPLLTHGALEPQSLKELKKSIDRQEIAHIILQTTEVKRVKRLRAGTADKQGNFINTAEDLSQGSITVEDGCLPRLSPSILEPQSSYSIDVELEGGFKCRVDTRAVAAGIQELKARMHNRIAYAKLSQEASSYKQVPTGEYRNIEEYFSVQHQFPGVYGLGKYGTSNSLIEGLEVVAKRDDREARVRQLRAYLLFFEQPMANYLAQLAHVGDLFSLDESLDRSYFYQPLAHEPPLASDPEKISDVLLQRPRTAPRASAHYVVCVVDPRGEIIFVTHRLPSQAVAQEIQLQIRESGLHSRNYRTGTVAPNTVQLILHNAAGAILAYGQERFTSIANAQAAAERWSSFMRKHAGSNPPAESPVKIIRRENLGLQIVNEQSEIVLTGNRTYTSEERERRIAEILECGIDRNNYHVRATANVGFSIDLHNPRDERIAEGEEIFATEVDAEEGVDALVTLLRRMKDHETVRERHVRRLLKGDEIDRSPLRSYLQGLARLHRHEDRDYLRRRNKILNHLLARFGEYFDDGILERLDLRPFGEKDDFFREMIRWKIEFLRAYVEQGDPADVAPGTRASVALGGGRALGFNYGEAEDSAALSGLERRVSLLLGLHGHDDQRKYSQQQPAPADPGFYYLEKQVWPLPPEELHKEDEKRTPIMVARQHIAGSWPKGEPDLNDLHHNFVFSSEDSSILRTLLNAGLDRKSYSVLAVGGGYHVLFHPPDSAQAIEIHRAHSREEAESSLAALLRQLQGFNASAARSYAGESMHVLEHILLRPHGDAGKCCVHIADPESGLHLHSTPVPRSQKDDHRELILRQGQEKTNYLVQRHSSGKYVVVLLDQQRQLATSARMFESEPDAVAAIAWLAELFCSLHREPEKRKKHVHTASPAKDDFYSHRVSVFLPNWPARFQSDEFKLYAEQLIYENAPAHLAVECFWLAVHEMADFEKLYRQWKSLKRTVQMQEETPGQQTSPEQTAALNEAATRLKVTIETLQKKRSNGQQSNEQRRNPGSAASAGRKAGES